MKNSDRAPQAFTLVELLIVAVTIGVLASLAVPRFLKTVDERYRREAKDVLFELLAADGAYRQEHGKYSNVIADLPIQDPNRAAPYPLTFVLTAPAPGTTTAVFRSRATYNRKSPPATTDLIHDPAVTPPTTPPIETGW